MAIKFGMITICSYLIVALTFVLGADEDNKYTTKFDNFDVDEVLKSQRLLKNYVECILEKGRCTLEGTELRKHISDGLQSDCNKCSEKQKQETDKILHYLKDNEPEYWKGLQEKYDPDGSYTKKYFESKDA